MRSCTFFGHRECPEHIKIPLRAAITDLIRKEGVEMFYVGDQGRFDAIAYGVLREIRKELPHIRLAVVLAYMPKNGDAEPEEDTMLPEGIELVHPKYAIAWRNDWMLRRSSYVVTYTTHSWGGAARYAQKAKKQGKLLIELAPRANTE